MAEFTEQIIEIIDKKDSAINTAESKLLNQLGPTEKLIFAEIKKLIDKFNVSGGKIDFNDANVELVNTINQTIVDAIQKSKMPGTIRQYLRDFDTIKEFNVDVHSKLNGLSTKELEDLINPIQKQMVQQTLDGLTGAGVDANFIEPVKNGIYKNIVGGSTRSDLEIFLNAYVVGTPELNGLYSRYVKQVSRDALGQFDGQINAKIAEEFGLDAFRYVGSIIDDSRAQCVRWVGKRILEKSEMQSEINWANNNGSGMIPGTTPENFLVYRGGYNCRHRAIPFKLTKSQRERLQKEQTTEATEETQKTDVQIDEIKNGIKKDSKKISNEKYFEENFYTTAKESDKKSIIKLIENQDDAIDISIENKTNLAVLTIPENNQLSKNQNPFKIASGKIQPMGDNSAGLCNIYNEYVSIKYDSRKSQQIVLRGYDDELLKLDQRRQEVFEQIKKFAPDYKKQANGDESITIDVNGERVTFNFRVSLNSNAEIVYKPFSISDVSELVDSNVAPTITHEYSHLIHNKYDPKYTLTGAQRAIKVPKQNRDLIVDFAAKKKFDLKDAPTRYGEVSWSEFYAECMAAYVHTPKWFERNHKNAFDFFVELNESVYGFDLSTLTQYK